MDEAESRLITCTNCGIATPIKNLIKLKGKYVCPTCFATIKVVKEKKDVKKNER